jgi:hypothetical protein
VKYSKVAAVLAGSVMAVGVAAPAFASTTGADASTAAGSAGAKGAAAAADAADAVNAVEAAHTVNTVDPQNMSTMPTSINGGVQQALDEQPVQKVAHTAHADSALGTVSQTTDHLKGATAAGGLVGQAATATQGVAKSGLAGAVPGASLLGGLPVGNLLGTVGGLGG